MIQSLLALASGTGAIIAHYRPAGRRAFVLLKPLTTLLILTVPFASGALRTSRYTSMIMAGLLFALVGDIWLLFPERYFVRGLVSFAITHLLYLLAFSLPIGLSLVHPLTIGLVGLAVLMARLIWSGIRPQMRLPILVYIVLITAMVAQAGGIALEQRTAGALLAAAGASLFFASDAVLAINRFRQRFAAAQALVLSTYWVGQWLIALSSSFRP